MVTLSYRSLSRGYCVSTIRSVIYSSVFSLLQKPANVRVEPRIVNGSEFQSEGPEAAKLRDPHRASRLRKIVRS